MATTATTAPVTAEAASKTAKKKKINWQSLPEIWALIHPRRGMLLLGLLLVGIPLLTDRVGLMTSLGWWLECTGAVVQRLGRLF